jgi:2-furoyl-CoA dehydrogenase large subunit
MSTPVCLANAVADALGIAAIDLPLTPTKIASFLHGEERPRQGGKPAAAAPAKGQGRALHGSGEALVTAAPQAIWDMLLDADTLASIIPGSHGVEKISDTHFRAEVTLGVGPVTGRYKANIELSDLVPPQSVTLTGIVTGALGDGRGTGHIRLTPNADGTTTLSYDYDAEIGGKVASIGGRLLDGAAKIVIRQFFAALARRTGSAPKRGLFARWFGGGA